MIIHGKTESIYMWVCRNKPNRFTYNKVDSGKTKPWIWLKHRGLLQWPHLKMRAMVWYRDRVVVRGTHLLNRWRVNNSHGHHKVVRKTVLHLAVLLANRTKVEATMHHTRITWRVLFHQSTKTKHTVFNFFFAVLSIIMLNWNFRFTLRWYFLCRFWRTFPV